jgi:pimeloyl-ACP methyl ester carboxylesterase
MSDFPVSSEPETNNLGTSINGFEPTMYEALSHPVNIDEGHEPNTNLYRDGGKPVHGKYVYESPFSGFVKQTDGKYWMTNKFEIAYTQRGDKGPLVLLLHGVPSNRYLYFPIQKRLAPFCRTIAIDMLGMGQSSMPRMYGKPKPGQTEQDIAKEKEYAGINQPWDWVFDTDYVDKLMNTLYPGEKFYFVADDWGSGISSHYAAKFDSDRLLGFIQIDPISFDGYPVSEIQAIGRASEIPVVVQNEVDDAMFKQAMGSVDQTMVQIFKTMVYDPNVWNQYFLRAIKHPYIDVDYDRSEYRDGEDATSLTLRLHWEALRVLADRAAILSPALLLPYDSEKNPKGVKFQNITVPTLVLWGDKDNMMPSQQVYRFKWVLKNAPVQIVMIQNAGHFAATDKPNYVSAAILDFISRVSGKESMGDVFLGFDGIWKGDEKEMIRDLREIYKI